MNATKSPVAVMRTAFGSLALSSVLFLEACASMTPPQEREPGYPSAWPDIASLGDGCVGLAGRYANLGTAVNPEGETRPIALTDILLEGTAQDSDSASLEAVMKKPPKSGAVTPAKLLIGPHGSTSYAQEISDCFCIQQALFCPGLHMSSFGGPGFGMISGQQNVWLTKGADGTLLVRIESHTTGVVLVVPVHSQSVLWTRFQQAPAVTAPHGEPPQP